jgi:hypothetical protein
MSDGIRLFNSAGGIDYDSSSVTWNLIGVYTAPQNASTSFTGIKTMTERIVVRQMVSDDNNTERAYVHTYSLSGTTLTATAPSSTQTQATTFQVFGR